MLVGTARRGEMHMENLKTWGIVLGSIGMLTLSAFVLSKIFKTQVIQTPLELPEKITKKIFATSTTNTATKNILPKTATDSTVTYTFEYGAKYKSKYLEVVDWPPGAQFVDEKYGCLSVGTSTDRSGRTEEKKINGENTCVTEILSEVSGREGTTSVRQYAYVFPVGTGTEIFTFSTEEKSCVGRKIDEKLLCEADKALFEPDQLAEKLFQTLRKI